MTSLRTCLALLFLFSSHNLFSQGVVYLVLGSDTAIWESMDVNRYSCTYQISLYTDPARNATRVMDPLFRQSLLDSYGTPVKLTWWMMAGNIFRHATNTNVPHPNTMTMYLMKKYHGSSIQTWGDELTLHYHTFVWTDYDGDGKYYWNQARSFNESSDDFDATLAAELLEEENFPVSFRSGWHAMDNSWQKRLNELLPYSLHNDWPAKHTDLTEPLDNTYDWSRAPSTFVPFRPSSTDYQVPGDGPGWNVRSRYMSAADSAFMDKIFAAAATGKDQMVCLWAHLPETDFLDNVRKVDASAHKAAPRYPGVKFRYCTAVEAMRLWRGTTDTVQPQISMQEISEGTDVRWSITSDEPLFQTAPFVAVKTRYGEFLGLPSVSVGERSWETTKAIPRVDLVKAGVAGTDTSGNLTMEFLRYLPDDIYIDDAGEGYSEPSGSWSGSTNASWGTSSRVAMLAPLDSAKAVWTTSVPATLLYQIFVQTPSLATPAQRVVFRVFDGTANVASREYTSGVPGNRWELIGTHPFSSGASLSVEMTAYGSSQAGTQSAADVVRISAAVRDKWLTIPEMADVGELIVGEERTAELTVRNDGIQPVVLTGATSVRGSIEVTSALPCTVLAMSSTAVAFVVKSSAAGAVMDTLVIASDDPRHATVMTRIVGSVREYFALVDDQDSSSYVESGAWNFSSGKAYGMTSRYAAPAPGVSAAFCARLLKGGVYKVFEIVPTTVNASVRARYVLSLDGIPVDTAFIDQNSGSGTWVSLLERQVASGSEARIELTDAMEPVVAGKVLRADAVRFQWVRDGTTIVRNDISAGDMGFGLSSNFPNPFNPETRIAFRISRFEFVRLSVYNLLGNEVAKLMDREMPAGTYTLTWNAQDMPSGVYFFRLNAGKFSETRRMLLMK